MHGFGLGLGKYFWLWGVSAGLNLGFYSGPRDNHHDCPSFLVIIFILNRVRLYLLLDWCFGHRLPVRLQGNSATDLPAGQNVDMSRNLSIITSCFLSSLPPLPRSVFAGPRGASSEQMHQALSTSFNLTLILHGVTHQWWGCMFHALHAWMLKHRDQPRTVDCLSHCLVQKLRLGGLPIEPCLADLARQTVQAPGWWTCLTCDQGSLPVLVTRSSCQHFVKINKLTTQTLGVLYCCYTLFQNLQLWSVKL